MRSTRLRMIEPALKRKRRATLIIERASNVDSRVTGGEMAGIPESHLDLLQSLVGTLATIGPDGRPQLTEVWFVTEGTSVVISLNTSRQKTKNLIARPACSFLILDLADTQRYLELRGDAVVTPDDDYAIADKVGVKYGAVLRDYDQPGDRRVVVRITPHRINAVDMRPR